MVELGQLEEKYAEFAKRNVRVVVVADDDSEDAKANQKDFPHLTVVADTNEAMAKAFAVIQAGVGHHGADTNAPTTFLISGGGKVQALLRPSHFITRYSPEEVLAAVDAARKG